MSQNARALYNCPDTLFLRWWTSFELLSYFFKKVVEETLHIRVVALFYIGSSYIFKTFAMRHASNVVHHTMEGVALQ